MAFSQLIVLVNNGNGTVSNVTIGLPPSASTDPFNDPNKGPGAQAQPGVAGLVEGIRRNGVWDSAGLNFFPPSAILKISPQ